MEIYRPPGSPVEHHGDFRDRIGHVIAVGENPHASAEQADAMLAAIEIDVRNDTPLERDET
jgi:biotin carboxylase